MGCSPRHQGTRRHHHPCTNRCIGGGSCPLAQIVITIKTGIQFVAAGMEYITKRKRTLPPRPLRAAAFDIADLVHAVVESDDVAFLDVASFHKYLVGYVRELLGGKAGCTIQPDGFAVEVGVGEDVGDQVGVFLRLTQA